MEEVNKIYTGKTFYPNEFNEGNYSQRPEWFVLTDVCRLINK
jgi:hypothetical protein